MAAVGTDLTNMITHFSHDHPLAFHLPEDENQQLDENRTKCSICGLPILSSPSYNCIIKDCNFSLHEPCLKLPEEIEDHPWHRFHLFSAHPLYLKSKQQPSGGVNFAYRCSECDFELHPLRAKPVEIKIKHESHHAHPLVAICREIPSLLCNACGEEHKGFFFSCQDCNFWIHQDCTLLPRNVKLTDHSHAFMLTYALSDFRRQRGNDSCTICNKELLCDGLYFCGKCICFAHPNCAKSKMESRTSEAILSQTIRLLDESGTFPSLVIRAAVDPDPNNGVKDGDYSDHLTPLDRKYIHDHPLVSERVQNDENTKTLVCNACVQPIISPTSSSSSSTSQYNFYYKCSEKHGCHFLSHKLCAVLPSNSKDLKGADFYGDLHPSSMNYFYSVFGCYSCLRPCNGFHYDFLDVECAAAPFTSTHAAHWQTHVLFLISSTNMQLRCCDDTNDELMDYRCASCDDFYIHVKCALLPKTVPHKFDKHPLELITNYKNVKSLQDGQEYFFCEVCEKDMDRSYWFYHCAKCDQSFHVNCIPSVGFLSKVKFGGALKIADEYHKHPVVLTRMLMEGNHRCGYCKKIIHGFVDTMAFQCSECHFWIHFTCARDCASDDGERQKKFFWEKFGWGRWVREYGGIWNIKQK